MSKYVSIHTHSEYSLIDGMCKIPELVKQAKIYDMPAIALTDHGSMGGSVKLFVECEEIGIKPIIGVEMYITEYANKEEAKAHGKGPKGNNHLILLAKNNEGYGNLKKIVTLANNSDNFYYRPRIDFNILSEHKEGLIVSSACIKGEIADQLVKYGLDGYSIAAQIAGKYKELFGDDYYFELMFHAFERDGIPVTGKKKSFKERQRMVFDQMVKMSKELNIKSIITNDCHYINKEDFDGHQIKKATQFHKKENDSLDGEDSDFNEYYLKSPEQMFEDFKGYEYALEQTLEIAEKCNVELPIGSRKKTRLPDFDIPEDPDFQLFIKNHLSNLYYLDKNAQWLTFLAWKGLVERDLLNNHEYVERLKYELAVINKTEFAKYLLIVMDYIKKSWELNNITGPARGSAAGSLVLNLIGITSVDPIKYDLSFERFLAAEKGTVLEWRDLI